MDHRITGESNNKLLLLLAAHTPTLALSNSDKNIVSTIGRGGSSAGKTTITHNVLRLFPNVLDFTGLTMQALHWAKTDFRGMNIFIRELEGAKTSSPSLRMVLTEGGLRQLTPQKDKKVNMKCPRGHSKYS